MAEQNPELSKVDSDNLPAQPSTRAHWEQPSIVELPKLTELTLLTGAGIPGSGGSGGSTVF
jgi:hypothetical protein